MITAGDRVFYGERYIPSSKIGVGVIVAIFVTEVLRMLLMQTRIQGFHGEGRGNVAGYVETINRSGAKDRLWRAVGTGHHDAGPGPPLLLRVSTASCYRVERRVFRYSAKCLKFACDHATNCVHVDGAVSLSK